MVRGGIFMALYACVAQPNANLVVPHPGDERLSTSSSLLESTLDTLVDTMVRRLDKGGRKLSRHLSSGLDSTALGKGAAEVVPIEEPLPRPDYAAVAAEVAIDWVTATAKCSVIYLCGKSLVKWVMDPSGQRREQESQGLNGQGYVEADEYEAAIANDIVDVSALSTTFEHIGGLSAQKEKIYETAILPLRQPEIFAQNDLVSAPTGILLYGPPGTGKTMLAKAVARESGATFIDLKMSTLMNKYFGETNKLVHALFTLAHKLAPTIIFIDEVDGFLHARGGDDGDPASMRPVKAEFMQLWDGLCTPKQNGGAYGVLIIGATNRPYDIDPAILRRMPSSFEVGLPDAQDRKHILKIFLKRQLLEEGFDMDAIAQRTDGYSGCDLKELCRTAAMVPVREALAVQKEQEMKSLNATRRDELGFVRNAAGETLNLDQLARTQGQHRRGHEVVNLSDMTWTEWFRSFASSKRHVRQQRVAPQLKQPPRPRLKTRALKLADFELALQTAGPAVDVAEGYRDRDQQHMRSTCRAAAANATGSVDEESVVPGTGVPRGPYQQLPTAEFLVSAFQNLMMQAAEHGAYRQQRP